jgi:acyl carrier protein
MSIESELVTLIATEYKKSEAEVKNAKKWTDLGLDSLDTVELVMRIEETYDVLFTDDETQSIKNLNDLVTLINSKRQ